MSSAPEIHPKARAFQNAVGAYERARPGYPPEAVEALFGALGLGAGMTVVEVGAGNGKFTAALAASGARVIAVEPVEAMRTALLGKGLGVEVLDGTAERLPAEAGGVDAVIAAQAFHWFDGPRALAEIRRVLRPDGGLGLIWNARDESSALQAGLTELMRPYEQGTPRYASGAWRRAFTPDAGFTPLEQRPFHHEQVGTRATVRDRVLSISFIAALPASERDAVARQVDDWVEGSPEAADPDRVVLPYRTDVYWCRKRA